jgi:hypothetical protein
MVIFFRAKSSADANSADDSCHTAISRPSMFRFVDMLSGDPSAGWPMRTASLKSDGPSGTADSEQRPDSNCGGSHFRSSH